MADVGETALSRPSRGLIGAKTHLDLAPHHPPTSSTTSLTHSLTQSTRHPGEKIRPLPDEATIYRPTSITETTSSKSIREGLFSESSPKLAAKPIVSISMVETKRFSNRGDEDGGSRSVLVAGS